MIQHPHQLHAQAALWSLRAALRYLAEHRDAVVIRRPQLGPPTARPQSLASLQKHDQLLREERAERAAGSLTGLKPAGAGTVPVAPGLIDLERDIHQTMVDVMAVLTYTHHRDPLRCWSGDWHRILDEVFRVGQDARWTWISVVLPATPPALAATVHDLLDAADQRIRSVCGVGADRIAMPLAPACPACGVRRLRVQRSAPDSARWTVVCASGSCWCLGVACGCEMGVRQRRVRHIWDADAALAVSVLAGVRAQAVRAAA